MAMYPNVPETQTSKLTTMNFYGLDYRTRIPDGFWSGMGNLSSDEAPMLTSRNPRTVIQSNLTGVQGILGLANTTAYVANGKLYYQGIEVMTGLDPEGPKKLVAFGSYIVVFPDKKYFNTEDDADKGDMGASWTQTVAHTPATSADQNCVYCRPCDAEGVAYASVVASATEPESPANGDVWVDTSGTTHTLSVYSSSQKQWIEAPTVYTRIQFKFDTGALAEDFANKFSEGDVVVVSGFSANARWTDFNEARGLQAEALNGEKEIIKMGTVLPRGAGGDGANQAYIVVIGILDGIYRQNAPITLERVIPTMDYVCEAKNRLWGCYYGTAGSEIVNEIYASALGDFKNWRKFQGVSTDSWAASVGSPGVWTGAVNYLGHPMFFKEQRIHQVNPSDSGAHSITETVCRGIEEGSWRSAVVVDETLFYKSPFDICMYQGALPKSVSDAFGDTVFHDAVAGACDGKYYISMQSAASDKYNFFVYDINKGMWHREDSTHVVGFADVHNDLYYMAAYSNDTKYRLVSELSKLSESGTVEAADSISWYATSGFQNWQVTNRLYVTRYVFRVALEEGATFRLQVRYDATYPWEDTDTCPWIDMGTIQNRPTTDSFLFPVRPRRCDHLQFRISGVGKFRLYSVTRILEEGSDL